MALQPDLPSLNGIQPRSVSEKRALVPEDKLALQNVTEKFATLYEFELLHATTMAESEAARRERRGSLLPRSIIRQDVGPLWQEIARESPQLEEPATNFMKALGTVYMLEDNSDYRISPVQNHNGKTIHAATRLDMQHAAWEIAPGDWITQRLARDILTSRVALYGFEDFDGTYREMQQHMLANLEDKRVISEQTHLLREEIGNAKSVSAITRKVLTGEIGIPSLPELKPPQRIVH